jgi:Fe-S-cluster containining protein
MSSESLKIPRLRFECTGCGACCTQRGSYAHVYVNDEEASALAGHLGVSVATFRRRFTFVDREGWRQLRFDTGACTFLDPETKRCTVYAARPVQCRTFPYWPELFDSKGWTADAKALCEGLGRGAFVTRREVLSSIRAIEERDRSDE